MADQLEEKVNRLCEKYVVIVRKLKELNENICSAHIKVENVELRMTNIEDKSNKQSVDDEIEKLEQISFANKMKIDEIDQKLSVLEEDQLKLKKSTKVEYDNPNIVNSEKSDLNCLPCEHKFENETHSRTHSTPKNARQFECNECESSFSNSHTLEQHMIIVHKKEKEYRCDTCGADFLLMWRLRKHITLHQKESRKCHFYNNDKECPYSLIGCKFLHEESKICKYADRCEKVMCQYRHGKYKTK